MVKAWVYILKCADGSYYTGKTQNLECRIAQHQQGVIKGYTSARRTVKLVFVQEFPSIMDAIRAERQIKGWSRVKKEALIRGDFDHLHVLAECKNRTHCRYRGSSFDSARDEVKSSDQNGKGDSPRNKEEELVRKETDGSIPI
jgi:predicted GIY-YIG superfamily endonuclease